MHAVRCPGLRAATSALAVRGGVTRAPRTDAQEADALFNREYRAQLIESHPTPLFGARVKEVFTCGGSQPPILELVSDNPRANRTSAEAGEGVVGSRSEESRDSSPWLSCEEVTYVNDRDAILPSLGSLSRL